MYLDEDGRERAKENVKKIGVGCAVLAAAMFFLVMVCVALTDGDDDGNQQRQTGTSGAAQRNVTTGSSSAASTVNRSGAYVETYVAQVLPLCEEISNTNTCIVRVAELEKGEPCPLMFRGWRSGYKNLPDGPFYLVQLEVLGESFSRYKQISSGSRYKEIPSQAEIFSCWNRFGLLQ